MNACDETLENREGGDTVGELGRPNSVAGLQTATSLSTMVMFPRTASTPQLQQYEDNIPDIWRRGNVQRPSSVSFSSLDPRPSTAFYSDIGQALMMRPESCMDFAQLDHSAGGLMRSGTENTLAKPREASPSRPGTSCTLEKRVVQPRDRVHTAPRMFSRGRSRGSRRSVRPVHDDSKRTPRSMRHSISALLIENREKDRKVAELERQVMFLLSSSKDSSRRARDWSLEPIGGGPTTHGASSEEVTRPTTASPGGSPPPTHHLTHSGEEGMVQMREEKGKKINAACSRSPCSNATSKRRIAFASACKRYNRCRRVAHTCC